MSPFTVPMSQCQSQGDGSDDDDKDDEEDAEDAERASVSSQADGLLGHVDCFFVTFKKSSMKMMTWVGNANEG